jgi:hypothetical protein
LENNENNDGRKEKEHRGAYGMRDKWKGNKGDNNKGKIESRWNVEIRGVALKK